MSETDATVLVAMPATGRRDHVAATIAERGHEVRTADDGIAAVGMVREADAVLAGHYPEPITDRVVEATTPPGVWRPNVRWWKDEPDASDDAGRREGDSPQEAVAEDQLPPDATVETVADAVDRAVERAAYVERVSAFSEVAAEAASSEQGSAALAERVACLDRDARSVQAEFSRTDWTAAFRSVPAPSGSLDAERPGNRTS